VTKRILALYEPGEAGDAAVELASSLAQAARVQFTVVSIVPQAPSGSRCGGSAFELNRAIREEVAKELDHAREVVWATGARAEFELLVEGSGPTLQAFAALGRYELILLPARRRLLRSGGHPAASALSRVPGAEVRIVGRPTAAAGAARS
jgi:Universal stress protein family